MFSNNCSILFWLLIKVPQNDSTTTKHEKLQNCSLILLRICLLYEICLILYLYMIISTILLPFINPKCFNNIRGLDRYVSLFRRGKKLDQVKGKIFTFLHNNVHCTISFCSWLLEQPYSGLSTSLVAMHNINSEGNWRLIFTRTHLCR